MFQRCRGKSKIVDEVNRPSKPQLDGEGQRGDSSVGAALLKALAILIRQALATKTVEASHTCRARIGEFEQAHLIGWLEAANGIDRRDQLGAV